MAFTFNQSFDPRIGTMQKIFGVIYVLITLVAISLAFYVRSAGQDGYLQFFMAGLFGLMAFKSFYISSRVKNLLKNGVYFKGKVDSVEAVRGITVIKGVVDIPDFGLIYIESRLAGETPARELKRYLEENKQEFLPALVVGALGKHPRGMFTIKCKNGHLDETSAQLKDESLEGKRPDEADAPADAAGDKAETKSPVAASASDLPETDTKADEVKAESSEPAKADDAADSKSEPATSEPKAEEAAQAEPKAEDTKSEAEAAKPEAESKAEEAKKD